MRASGFRFPAGMPPVRAAVMAFTLLAMALAGSPPAGAAEASDQPVQISYPGHKAVLHSRRYPDGAGVVIRLFATDTASQGRAAQTDDQDVIRATERIRESAPQAFAHEIERYLRRMKEIPWVMVGGGDGPGESVILDGRFTAFDTGYRGSVGKPALVAVEGTMRGSSGELLLEFRFERAGGTSLFSMTSDPAADHHEAMLKATQNISKDLVKIMKRWIKGKYE